MAVSSCLWPYESTGAVCAASRRCLAEGAVRTLAGRTPGVGSNNVKEGGASVGIQAILEVGHCRSFSDVWRQSTPRSGRTYSKSRFPAARMGTWLTYFEFVPSGGTSSWRFKESLRRQVQATMEQLAHRDESSRANGSLHRGAIWFRPDC